MKKFAYLLVILAVSACSSETEDTDVFSDPADFDGVLRCGAENFQNLLGKRESALVGVNLPDPHRILHPEDIITLDFSPDRLTIDIDGLGLISSITCR